ncbi:hypothetical protein [Dietzia timorensis]|uniref:Uncharacterized protein n=1 Tax=Dietzia timorensis TaxID=499555 RepID=A0A173LGU7_9ACTN|nr:hypothetical protein [Dietzia timorensis]ANI91093.1 Hypothetical protein BJL86_0282 [Dietzia timorensis]
MTALSSLELRLRGFFYRLPLILCAVIAALAVVLVMFGLFGSRVVAQESQSGEGGFPVFQAGVGSVMAAFFIWWGERNKRAEFPDAEERLRFDRVVLDPTSVGEGEVLPSEWRKELRSIADSKAMGFIGFVLLAPVALIGIVVPASNGEAIWPSVVFVSTLFALVAVGAALGIQRARNAELALGISQSDKVA